MNIKKLLFKITLYGLFGISILLAVSHQGSKDNHTMFDISLSSQLDQTTFEDQRALDQFMEEENVYPDADTLTVSGHQDPFYDEHTIFSAIFKD